MAASREHMGKKETKSAPSAKTSGHGIGMTTQRPLATGFPGIVKSEKMSDEVRMRAEADMGTLHRAHQIITDKPRHAAAQQHAAEVFAAASAPGVSVSKKGRG